MTNPPCRRVSRVARLLAMAVAMLLLPLSTPSAAYATLPEGIVQLLNRHRIPVSAVSVDIRELNSPIPLLRVNAKIPRNPASVIKLVTVLAALETLGPGYQWETTYLADGDIKGGVLDGNLILKGGGDPFLTVQQVLGHVLALRQSGIQTVNGRLVIDNSLFSVAHHDPGEFDDDPERLYNVGPDAALTNFSATYFVLEPRGEQIQVRADPPLAKLKVVNRIQAQDGKCIDPNAGWSFRISRLGDQRTAYFRGKYRRDCGTHGIGRSFLSSTDYTHQLFTALWRAMGGKIRSGYRVRAAPNDAQILLVGASEPLADIITGINKFSNNVMSRQLLLTLAAEQHGAPGTVAAGVLALRNWLVANQLPMPELVIDNGSGLSRDSRMSAHSLAILLQRAWASTYRPEFVSSLPLAAIDGTMRSRLNDGPLHGRARIKTGAIQDVRSMAGYVHARDDRHYSVVMMIDSSRVHYWNGNEIQDELLRWVYAR